MACEFKAAGFQVPLESKDVPPGFQLSLESKEFQVSLESKEEAAAVSEWWQGSDSVEVIELALKDLGDRLPKFETGSDGFVPSDGCSSHQGSSVCGALVLPYWFVAPNLAVRPGLEGYDLLVFFRRPGGFSGEHMGRRCVVSDVLKLIAHVDAESARLVSLLEDLLPQSQNFSSFNDSKINIAWRTRLFKDDRSPRKILLPNKDQALVVDETVILHEAGKPFCRRVMIDEKLIEIVPSSSMLDYIREARFVRLANLVPRRRQPLRVSFTCVSASDLVPDPYPSKTPYSVVRVPHEPLADFPGPPPASLLGFVFEEGLLFMYGSQVSLLPSSNSSLHFQPFPDQRLLALLALVESK